MKKKKVLRPYGITLVELIVVLAIFAFAILVTDAGMRYLISLYRQKYASDAQREAQAALHEITKDIRNAHSVVSISSDTLVLRMFNTSLGYDTGAGSQIFAPAQLGTVTYRYDPNQDALLREAQFPTKADNQTLLKNMLVTPPIGTNNIFWYFSSSNVIPSPPYEGAKVYLRMKPKYGNDTPRVYEAESMKRTLTRN